IIVLLILAGISIQALTNTGLFEKAGQAKKEAKRAQVTEWLNLKLIEEQTYNPTGTAEEIIEATRASVYDNEELEKMGKNVVVDENTSTQEDGEEVDVYFYVQVDEDVYKVEMAGVQFIGEEGKFPPVITIESMTSTTNSITIKIKVSRNEEGTLEIYKKSEDDTNYTIEKRATGEEATGLEYTISGLKQNEKYSIKIVATAKNGQVKEYTEDIKLGSVPDLAEGDITFTYSVDGEVIDKETWTNKEVTVTASTEITGYALQTSKDGISWNDATSQTFTENGQIHVVLYDGTNYGSSATGNVINIDTTKPIVTEATATTNSIEITATDEASGIIGYAVTTSNTAPADSSYTTVASTTSLSTTVTGKIQGTTYYVWVKDEAGNISESKSTSTGSIAQASGASYTPTSLTNGNVTVTLPTISGFITRYTTDGSTPTMSNGIEYTTTITVSNNCTIKYIYTDGNNIGEEGTLKIENIDKTNPSTPTISLTTTSSWVTAKYRLVW
ncbi:MAG: FN3 associated domain-containing protein, partial [Candidatus Coprovivens sp.]